MQLTLEKSYIAGKPVRVDDLGGQLFGGEANAHKFVITQYAAQGSSETVAITGEIAATMMLSNGVAVPVTGYLQGGKAVIVLSSACYSVPGRFVLSIFATSGDVTLCIYCGVGNVLRTSGDTVAYPTESLPNLAQLVDQVQDAIDSFPADLTAIQAAIAANYDDLPYPITAGTYAWHAGTLYKSKTDIATTEAWTAAHWETVHAASDLAANVSQLKSAFDELPKTVETEESDADLYITDQYGYVLAQFSGGHIQTKEFDSADVGDLNNLETDDKTTLVDAINDVNNKIPVNVPSMEITDSDASLDIVDNSGNVVLRLKGGHIQTKEFDSTYMSEKPYEYMFSDGVLMLGYGYTNENDAVVCLNNGRANDLFDFKEFLLKPKGKRLIDCTVSDLSSVWRTGTDMHSPFQFLAVNNPDGYYAAATNPSYTGGNHTVKVDGTPYKTAKPKYAKFYADGHEVSSGYGVFDKFEIRWANEVQAYNCVKTDGTGRTSLIEYHDMVFDGVEFKEHVVLVPTEDIRMSLWSAFQVVGWKTVCDHVRFIDGANHDIFTTADTTVQSGNAATRGLVEWGNDHTIEMTIDTEIGLGKRQYYSGTKGAHMSDGDGTKGYFFVIYGQSVSMEANTSYDVCGTFRFYPTIEGGINYGTSN